MDTTYQVSFITRVTAISPDLAAQIAADQMKDKLAEGGLTALVEDVDPGTSNPIPWGRHVQTPAARQYAGQDSADIGGLSNSALSAEFEAFKAKPFAKRSQRENNIQNEMGLRGLV
jgi:hypothetical protein